MSDTLRIRQAGSGRWHWRVVSASGTVVDTSDHGLMTYQAAVTDASRVWALGATGQSKVFTVLAEKGVDA